ncbi:MAG: G5 domain-containing protein [Clostridia bacterium]|nr:G5 domain-containing protein [Clostridia bacterium]
MKYFKSLNYIIGNKWKEVLACTVAVLILTTSAVSVSSITNYKIIDNGNEKTIISLRKEAGKILDEAGIKLEHGDKYSVDESQPQETKIEIHRAFEVELSINGESKSIKTTRCTVGEFLAFNNVSLKENDVLNCDLEDEISEGKKIAIDSVELRNITEQKEIPFEVISKETDRLKKGKTKVETPGQRGIKEITYSQKYINGQLVESSPVSERILKEPIKQVNLVGTKKHNSSHTISDASGVATDNHGNPLNYVKTITGVTTAYCDKGRTSTGRKAQSGVVAVDPRVIPYGTKLFIPGYGYAVAGDTGGAMRSGKVLIDVWFSSNAECNAWGRRTKTVYIL